MQDDSVSNFLEGKETYQSARMKRFWKDMLNHLTGRSVGLWNFDEIRHRLRLKQESYIGLRDIPLDRIVGSVGRYEDFSAEFLPTRNVDPDRWANIYAQTVGAVGLPPIDVYKVDDVYFVRDGNHRVSVARQLDAGTIQAYVTELKTPIDLEPNMSRHDWSSAEAYAHFLEVTELDETRPNQERIMLSEPPRYRDLIEQIQLVGMIRAHRLNRDVPLREAAARWYDIIYKPAIDLIRKYKIMDLIARSKRTEADLFLWISEHLMRIFDAHGEDAPDLRLSDAIKDYLRTHNIPVPSELEQESDAHLLQLPLDEEPVPDTENTSLSSTESPTEESD